MESQKLLLVCIFMSLLQFQLCAQEVETTVRIITSRTLDSAFDLHVTDKDNPIADGEKVNITSPDAFLFFDNIKPNDVIKRLKSKVMINGSALNPKTNCRVVVYRHGAIVMAHAPSFCPLTTYTDKELKGESAQYLPDMYYTNSPDSHTEMEMVRPLKHDNNIRSFILKRGYSATFANEPDGMGYSRVFIADDHDLVVDMPEQIDQKASFIRIAKWQYPSKKGWAGSVWSSAPNGLQYVNEQCDYTNSTWFYNWGTSTDWTTNPNANDSTYNQEFVPEKWGTGDAAHKLLELKNVSHLLGYNEPDHTEQSNVSVEKAIEEWPQLLRTGLRLGSPATTNFSWLYSFMSEAKKKNYRVDYVVIHAYWGGLSGNEWYAKLKEVHDKTGCPIWIKEWNNGANWTKEGWPSGTEAQQQKQLNDLKQILTVMDTCSFVERYSIYNWVQDKRAIILNGKLTPAGEYYAANQPEYFFNKDGEVVPTWRVREAPVLSYMGFEPDKGAIFKWTDPNGEMIPWYQFEYSSDGKNFETLLNVTYAPEMRAEDNTEPNDTISRIFYRVKSVTDSGAGKTSNVVFVNYINAYQDNDNSPLHTQDIIINEQWSLSKFSNLMKEQMGDNPFILIGTPTYRNKMPLTPRIAEATNEKVDIQLSAWQYQQNPLLLSPDTIALLIWKDSFNPSLSKKMAVEGGKEWKHIEFDIPFDDIPVLLTTTNSSYSELPTSIKIRNVDRNGFDIKIMTEEALKGDDEFRQINVLALEQGMHDEGNYIIIVGRTPENAVGSSLTGGYTINFEGIDDLVERQAHPCFFSEMQTANDEIASTLRIKLRDHQSATLIKDREKSATYSDPAPETVGWMAVIRKEMVDGTNTILTDNANHSVVYSLNGIRLTNIPLKNGIYLVKSGDGNVHKVLF